MAFLKKNVVVQKKGLILLAVHHEFDPKDDTPIQKLSKDMSISLSECLSMLPVRITRCYRCSDTDATHGLDAFTEMISKIHGIEIERHVGEKIIYF